jgi:quercetin dioxygenase-like cupin family protein
MKGLLLTIIVIFVCVSGKSQYNKDIIIEPILKTDTTTIGQKIIYPHFADDEITILKVTILPGKSTGWHKHEFPVFAYILKGNLTVELENGKTMQFSENSSFSEVINTFHNGINKGKENVVLIAFYMGGKGAQLSVRKE